MLCPEATTSSLHRGVDEYNARNGALTNLFTGRPARGMVNRLMRELGPINAVAPEFPLCNGCDCAIARGSGKGG